jgi:hypothetical protein
VQNSGNNSAKNGAGVWLSENGIVIVINNIITNNDSYYFGGGIYNICEGEVNILNNTISENIAIGGEGGGIYSKGHGSVITINNNVIANNLSERDGGGGLYIDYANTVSIANNKIMYNSGEEGGGIRIDSVNLLTLLNNIIYKNFARKEGAGIVTPGVDSIILTNNTFSYNDSVERGGAISIWLKANDNNAVIYNNIIWNNNSAQGKDLYINNDYNGDWIPSPVDLFNNDFDQSPAGTYIQIPFPLDPSNFNNLDPFFVNPVNDDYHMTKDSPCIDAGDNDAPEIPPLDLDGNIRIWDGNNDSIAVVDMGAYEYGSISPVPVPDIKANGSDGPLTITQLENLSVTVALDAGYSLGDNADWWCVADTPFGWFHYELVGGWEAGLSVSHQGPLLDLFPPFEVLNMSGLPVGDYEIYFGVDDNMNGKLDGTQYYDSVNVTVTP